jgi:RNA polymerase sigma factor (sigma-70 family)
MTNVQPQHTQHMAAPGECVQMPLAEQIQDLFNCAEPRLQRLARSQQIAPDALDDIVQETLIEAWKSLDHLRDETRFAAWLDGICRNVCLRYQRRQGILRTREQRIQALEDQPDGDIDFLAQLADPATFDPTEELTRRDMAVLLDRALGHLPRESRAAVEQHYLAEIPQRELAARMGLSLSALEARLHRARSQLLHILSHDLRGEALAMGLAVLPEDAAGWRETQMECIFCGQQRMSGMFGPMADGRIEMRLRCISCGVEISSAGLVDLSQARSFLPATKKVVGEYGRYIEAALVAAGACRCWVCQRTTHLMVARQRDPSPQTWLQSACGCLRIFVSAVSFAGSYPEVREFLLGSGAILIESEIEMTYTGQDALHFGLLSPASGRRLAVIADAKTLLPFAVIQE